MLQVVRPVGVYLPLMAFNSGQMQDLVISEPVMRYAAGVVIDEHSMMRLGVPGMREALRLQHNGSPPHQLKIALEFPLTADPAAGEMALEQLRLFVHQLRVDMVLFNTSAPMPIWMKLARALLQENGHKKKVRSYMLQGEGIFPSINPEFTKSDQFLRSIIPTERKHASTPALSIAAAMEGFGGDQQLQLILHPEVIRPDNIREHESLLRLCYDEVTARM